MNRILRHGETSDGAFTLVITPEEAGWGFSGLRVLELEPVRRFPGPGELAAKMSHVGLRQIRYVLTAGGIIALHVGQVS